MGPRGEDRDLCALARSMLFTMRDNDSDDSDESHLPEGDDSDDNRRVSECLVISLVTRCFKKFWGTALTLLLNDLSPTLAERQASILATSGSSSSSASTSQGVTTSSSADVRSALFLKSRILNQVLSLEDIVQLSDSSSEDSRDNIFLAALIRDLKITPLDEMAIKANDLVKSSVPPEFADLLPSLPEKFSRIRSILNGENDFTSTC
ncbi:unnamed protein product [Amoebophrya sp. A25]|nr:unnamed protein product [Amoebophrya sp. A25]|eukprot:GSA25T00026954001.1